MLKPFRSSASTGDSETPLFSRKEMKIAIAALLVQGVFSLYDFSSDLQEGSSFAHLSIELLIATFGLLVAGILLRQLVMARNELRQTRSDLAASLTRAEDLQKDSMKWQSESSKLLKGLSDAIDRQFDRWKFSPAEKEVALLLLKGLSSKEIATIRKVAEPTVRQQTVAIYGKSGLGGRAELSAFFLEDLLVPIQSS